MIEINRESIVNLESFFNGNIEERSWQLLRSKSGWSVILKGEKGCTVGAYKKVLQEAITLAKYRFDVMLGVR